MKKIILIHLLFYLSSFIVFSQSGWTPLNTNTNQDLNCVYFVDTNIGFVGGSVLIKTTNRGISWITLIDSSNNLYIKDIDFINSNTGYFVHGSNGIKKTTGWRYFMEFCYY